MKNTIICTIEDMTCNGCVKRITQAIQKLDSQAEVSAELSTKSVTIVSTIADQTNLTESLSAIGYTPKFN